MPSARLSIRPPELDENIVALKIWEAPAQDGPFALIETTSDVGTPPDYISEYTTDLAISATDWFSISWVDSKGAETEKSEAVQGGTETLVHQLANRIELRNPAISAQLAIETAEYVISTVLNAVDPYDPLLTATYRQLQGMTLISLAQIQLEEMAGSTTADSWTAGLVSMKSSTGSHSIKDIQALLDQAARILGISRSRVAQMIPPEIAGGLSQIVSADISRLQIEVE